MLNCPSDDSERTSDSAAWTGSSSARTTVAGVSGPPRPSSAANTDDTFWPMNTRYATVPPVCDRMMVASVKCLPIRPKHLSPRSP